jgi:hypothetical protein
MFSNVSANALGRRQMHPETGSRVYLDNAAAGLREPFGNIRGNNIYTRDVKTDDTCDTLE